MKFLAFYIYKLFTYDAWLISYYMHEHEDFFCKIVKPGIIAKFAGRGKNVHWAETAGCG